MQRVLFWSLLPFLFLLRPSDAALGQIARSPRTPAKPTVFLPAPRELRQELNRARQAILDERYVDAILRLDLVLTGGNEDSEYGEDYFFDTVSPNNDKQQLQSLKARALQMISELPPAGREAYELQFGADARQQLTACLERRDFQQLANVARRYAQTRAGQEATLLLGRYYLSKGDALGASLQFQRLNNDLRARERFGAELQVLLATALTISGREEAAKETLAGYSNPGATFVRQGAPAPWLDASTDPLEWLSSVTGSLDRRTDRVVNEWTMFGGNPQRSALTDVAMPLQTKRWELPFTHDPRNESALDRQAKAIQGQAATPSLYPLIVDGWVLMRSAERLLGVDLASGKREWAWVDKLNNESALFSGPFGRNVQTDTQVLRQRVWEDALYGQLSSDGSSVYFLNKRPSAYSSYRLGSLGPSNEMIALDLKRQGYRLWTVGGVDGNDEAKLAGVFFLGPPLPVDGELYAIGEVNGEIRLLALAPDDGQLNWSQQLAHVETRYATARAPSSERRLAGVNPAHAGGILVCPTSAGGVVAVDIANRSLLWGFTYPIKPGQRRNYAAPQLDRWRDGSVTIVDGAVVLTPIDSQEIFCLDLLTGKSLWQRPQRRGSNLYVGGSHEGKLFLVGKHSLTCLDVRTSKNQWTLALDGGASPAGRGVQSGGHYYLATTTPEMIKIDLDQGRIVDRIPTDEPMGNLVAYRDQIIAQNHESLRCYFQRDKLEARVQARLASNPNDPWAHEHQALIDLNDGRRREGLAGLRRTLDLLPEASEDRIAVRLELIETILDMLRENEPGSAQLASELEMLIDPGGSQRLEYLRLIAINLQRDGHLVEAFRRNQELLLAYTDSDQSSLMAEPNSDMVRVNRQREVRRDRWFRATFGQLWEAGSVEQQAEIAELIHDALARVAEPMRRTLIDAFQDLPPAHPALLEDIANELETAPARSVAEGTLLRLAQRSEAPSIAAGSLALLAKLYVDSGRTRAATNVLERLDLDYSNEPVLGAATARELRATLITNSPSLRRFMEQRGSWPYGSVSATEGENKKPSQVTPYGVPLFDQIGQTYSIDTQNPFASREQPLDLVYDQANGQLQFRDSVGVKHLLVSMSAAMPQARRRDFLVQCHGHLIVVSRRDSMMVVDGLAESVAAEDKIVWQQNGDLVVSTRATSAKKSLSFSLGLTREIASGLGGRSPMSVGAVSDRGIVIRRWGDLQCLDPATGEILWTRNDIPATAEVWGDDQHAFVHHGTDRLARVFHIMDGTELESRSVPEQRRRIRNNGRYVLSERDDIDGVRLQLNDLFGSWIWNHTFDTESRAAISGNLLVVFEPGKGIKVLSLQDGRMIVEHATQTALKQVDRIAIERRVGLLIVTLGHETTDHSKFRSPISSQKLQQIEVYAFDGQSGAARWSSPAMLQDYLPMELHASELPVLLYMRREETKPKRSFRTLVLDARDGRTLLETSILYEGKIFRVQGDPETSMIRLRAPAEQGEWNLKFTDSPRPPSPPSGHETNVVRGQAKPFGYLGRILFDSLRKSTQLPNDDDLQPLDEEAMDEFEAPAP